MGISEIPLLLEKAGTLPPIAKTINEGVRLSLAISSQDPEMALTRSRKMLEYIVRQKYEAATDEPAGTRSLEKMLHVVAQRSGMPRRLIAYAHSIQEIGNVATHSFDEGITSEDVVQSLKHLLSIAAWSYDLDDQSVDQWPPEEATEPGDEETETPPEVVTIVPRGLRSFDENDSEFFLRLLPGPLDADGLPESVQFWKNRLERVNDFAFPVGLLYGPSGSGKSSFMRAGLIPRMSSHVETIYVEASGTETEHRVLDAIHRQFSTVPQEAGLVESFTALRENGTPSDKTKIVIVFDQFEQWLHAHHEYETTELAAALRQCDGRTTQCVLLVRDDFWMSVTRFMQVLGMPLREGDNAAAVDLFDVPHARKVLIEFGRAYGRLPDVNDLSAENSEFVNQVIEGLVREGRVISVRLSLFADILKDKPWTPQTLRAMGGTEGIGVRFLEGNLSRSSAPPWIRAHINSVRYILRVLLPDGETDLKGQMRSKRELLSGSGFSGDSELFDEILRFMNEKLHIITPCEPVDTTVDENGDSPEHFQLTHDYLVHSITEWLSDHQKQTSRGRAEIRLAECTALWNARPESQRLPGLVEFSRILALVPWKGWAAPQKSMMRAASRFHGTRLGAALAMLCLSAIAAVWLYNQHAIKDVQLEVAQDQAEQNLYVAEVSLAYRYFREGEGLQARHLLSDHASDESSFEVNLLEQQIESDSTLYGHRGPIRFVAFSPRGDYVASASYDGTATVWEVGDANSPRYILEGAPTHNQAVFCAAFYERNDTSFLATANLDKTVKIFELDLDTGSGGEKILRPVVVLDDHVSVVTSVAISDDGRYLASGGDDAIVNVYEFPRSSDPRPVLIHQLRQPTEDPNNVHSVAFCPDSHLLAAGIKSRLVMIWDLADLEDTLGTEVERPARFILADAHSDEIYPITFSPQGRYLASGGSDNRVVVWEMSALEEGLNRSPWMTLEGHESDVYCLGFADERTLASGDADGTVRFWDLNTDGPARLIAEVDGHAATVFGLAFQGASAHADGLPLMATGSTDATIKLWEPVSDSDRFEYEPQSRIVVESEGVSYSHSGDVLAFDAHQGAARSVLFAPDDSWVATSGEDARVCIWDPATWTMAEELVVFGGGPGADQVGCLAVSPRGDLLAAGTGDWKDSASPGRFFVWRVSTNDQSAQQWSVERVGSVDDHDGAINDIAFSPDGSRMVTASCDQTIKVWDTQTWSEVEQITGHSHWVWSVTYAGDDAFSLFSASHDLSVRNWNPDCGAECQLYNEYLTHSVGVVSMIAQPRQNLLLTGGFDNRVIARDLDSEESVELLGHTGPIWSLAMSSEGRTLASGSWDGTVRLWRFFNGDDQMTAYEITTLTPHEGVVSSASAEGSVYSVAFSHSDDTLLAAYENGMVYVWNARRRP